jgi:hypothetical protein
MHSIAKSGYALALVALSLVVCVPGTARADDFSGAWTVSGKATMGNMVMTIAPVCTFTQSNGTLGGNCNGPSYAGSVTGAVDGKNITWTWAGISKSDSNVRAVAKFKGTLGPDGVIHGTWTSSQMTTGEVGNFSAHKQ